MRIEFFEECIIPTATAQQRGRRRYDPVAVKNTKAFWRAIGRRHKPGKPFSGALRAVVVLTWPFTKGQAKKGLQRPILKETKPDTDNTEKAMWDAFEKEGFFKVGDQQLADKHITKWHGPIPGVAIIIEESANA